jgi:Copine/C2 domain
MGAALFEIGECLGARGNIKAKKMNDGGTLFCRVAKAAAVEYGTIELGFRGIKLKNVDGMFSKSDPFLVLSAQSDSAAGRTWFPVHRSEVVQNDLNPIWQPCSIPMEKLCDGDKSRPILIEVFDWEKSGKHQAMGRFETTVNGLMAAVIFDNPANPKAVSLHSAFTLKQGNKDFGNIVVTKASITGENLTPKQPQLASEMVHAAAHFQQATGVGGSSSNFANALGVAPGLEAYGSSPYSASGSQIPPPMAPPIPSQRFSPGTIPKFIDYLEGGCEINLVVAIDFTGSNGDPRLPGTLHYIHPNDEMNEYEKALTAVGSIVARYDSDQQFPVFGFGAKYEGVIQHCFQIGGAAELDGVGGILKGYRQTFRTGLVLSGPTVFSEVINMTASQAASREHQAFRIGKQAYSILLILTDGAVTDIEQTKQAIRAASSAPLSIVIVGVGNADFSKMQFLDDFQREEGGKTRDIVQFVEFARHRHNRRTLTKETLDEIPDQLVNYFYGKGILPLPPISGSKFNLEVDEYDSEDEMKLDVTWGSDGNLRLDNVQQAHYNGQAYGTSTEYLAPKKFVKVNGINKINPEWKAWKEKQNASSSLPPPMAPASFTPAAAAPPAGCGGVPGAAPKKFTKIGGINQINSEWTKWKEAQDAAAATPMPPPTMVYIQCPVNAIPGMQIQVQNPKTGQFQMIAIPPGVPPGAMFGVNL